MSWNESKIAKIDANTDIGLLIKSDKINVKMPKNIKIDEKRVMPFSSVKMGLIGRHESVETMTNSPMVKEPDAYFIKMEMTIRPNIAENINTNMFSFVSEKSRVMRKVTIMLNRKSVDGTSVGESIKSNEKIISTDNAGYKRGDPTAASVEGTLRNPHIIPLPAPCLNCGLLLRIDAVHDVTSNINKKIESMKNP